MSRSIKSGAGHGEEEAKSYQSYHLIIAVSGAKFVRFMGLMAVLPPAWKQCQAGFAVNSGNKANRH